MPRSLALLLLTTLAGCPTPDPSSGLQVHGNPDTFLDYNDFVCDAQPVLIRHCSYLACHGNADHALRIYSAGKLRIDTTDSSNARDATLTAAEVEGNFASASGLLYAATAEQRATGDISALPLLAKPLASRFGGAEHHGVGIFPVPPAATPQADPEFEALLAWVAGKKQSSPVDSDCANLFSGLNLMPRTP